MLNVLQARFWLCGTALVAVLSLSGTLVAKEVASNQAPTGLAQRDGVYHAVLENGMELYIKPDHRAPTAVHMLWIRAGALDEAQGRSGAAHVLEHMMFKGTPKVPAGEFSRQVAALGGRENAFTAQDYTGYYQQIPKEKLARVMELESDRFANSRWADSEFIKEIEVVKEERRMRTEDNPQALLYEQLLAATYTNHPYRKPIVGWMPDLDALKPDDVRAYYRDWYHPHNAAIVVAGDVEPAQVLALAQKTYGRIPAKAVALALTTREAQLRDGGAATRRLERLYEPEQMGARRVELKASAEDMQVYLAFKVPSLLRLKDLQTSDHDALALIVLSAVLDGYDGARYAKALVRSEPPKAKSAFSSYGLWGRGPQLFLLGATPVDKDPVKMEVDLLWPIALIAKEGVEEKELTRVKNQWTAEQIYGRDSVFNQARMIGSQWAAGLPADAEDRLIELLKTVTVADVRRVAQKYFSETTQMTAAVLYPQPKNPNQAPRRSTTGIRH